MLNTDLSSFVLDTFHPSYHFYSLWVQRLYEDSSARGHALHQLVERRTFDLLSLQVSHTVQEIKQHTALLQLLAEQIMQLCHWGVWKKERERREKLDTEVKGHKKAMQLSRS